ncbi:hypothetical protein DM01DRAFT_1403825 [Hesseltinella vesiculosa]|uniref:BZIP domain-containing protein n=1 Tax=Hesseltinella vesiculosa TaxID=101127 RepID=A0A1X2GVS0_9FUNG|nr:hypothetical protein DM01DRAFT_1403825 [Hesseltinella vesiculosa]
MTLNKQDEDLAKRPRFSFQYFDEACDVGVENENGERIRRRKRPGRKPNPPTQQERRAQNRVAQRNFREREQQRRQERERLWQQYTDELNVLKKRLATSEYEANYLRGWILHMMLDSLAKHGTVPQTWIDTRVHPLPHPSMIPIPLESLGIDETAQLPPMLLHLLDPEGRHIMDKTHAIVLADTAPSSAPTCPLVRRACHARERRQQFFAKRGQVVDEASLPLPPRAIPPCNSNKSVQDYLFSELVSLNINSQDVRQTFPTKVPSLRKPLSDPHSSSDASCSPSSSPPPPSLPPLYEHLPAHLLPPSQTNRDTSLDLLPSTPVTLGPGSPPVLDRSKATQPMEDVMATSPATSSPTPPPSASSTTHPRLAYRGTICEPPVVKRAEDLTHLSPLQVAHILRFQMKLGSIIGEKIQYALTPTALQRIIPHDVRIDYIPAGSIRDRMIVFQDYFDMDECFQCLTSQSMFTGGDIRNMKNWVFDDQVTDKFWFLSHRLYDHAYDDCHISEEFANHLKEWTVAQQLPSILKHEHLSSPIYSRPNRPAPTSSTSSPIPSQRPDSHLTQPLPYPSAFMHLPTPQPPHMRPHPSSR